MRSVPCSESLSGASIDLSTGLIATAAHRGVVALLPGADDDVRALALRLKEAEDFRPRFVLQQIAGIQAMRRKMPHWADNQNIIYHHIFY